MYHHLEFSGKSLQIQSMTLLERDTFLQKTSDFGVKILRSTGFLRPPMMQVAALCHRPKGSDFEILLVTSLGRKAWILPKGWPKENCSSAQAAMEEAYEEAGIHGVVSDEPIGTYNYRKSMSSGLKVACFASVYEIAVTDTAESFPEHGQREIKWAKPEDAAKLVSDSDLKELILSFTPTLQA